MSRLKKFCAGTGCEFSESGCKRSCGLEYGKFRKEFACHLNSFVHPQTFVRVLSTALSSRQPSVVIADDSAVAREGLVAIIRRDLGYTVCGLATDERTMRELTEKHHPDLLVVEPFLGHHDGIFLLKQLAARFPRVADSRCIETARRNLCRTRAARGRLRVLDENQYAGRVDPCH